MSGGKFITSAPGSLAAQPEDEIPSLQRARIPGRTPPLGFALVCILWMPSYDQGLVSYWYRLPWSLRSAGARANTSPHSILPSRGFGSTPGKGQGGEWGFVEGVRRPERFFCLYLTNKTNILFRNTFKELPWSSHLSFSKTYSSRLQAACFMGWGKMNTVPAQMQGQNILLHPTLTHISCSQNTLWYAVSGDKKRIDHNY